MKKALVLASFALCACSGGTVPTMAPLTYGSPHASSTVPKGAAKEPLLFVSDATKAAVYIYQLTTLKVVGTVTGLTQPQGECSDSKGDVWVTDTGAHATYELSHAGRLENTLSAASYPVGCAWDSSSGNVAVMSLFGGSGSQGQVAIYTKGKGSPQSYVNEKQYYYNFGGYDPNGNLFFDGRSAKGTFMLSELPKGAKSAYTIKLRGGRIYFPGMVQWDSSNDVLVVGDQSCGNLYTSCLYTVKLAGETGTIESKIQLQNTSGGEICDLVQGVIYNGELFGSDDDICTSAPSTTYVWPYPAGGAPSDSNSSTDTSPVGAAVSP